MVSRQRLHQQKLRALGRCVTCAQPAEKSKRRGSGGTSCYCIRHLVAARERQHKKHQSRRNLNAPSYLREKKQAESEAERLVEAQAEAEWKAKEVSSVVAPVDAVAPDEPSTTIERQLKALKDAEFFYARQGD